MRACILVGVLLAQVGCCGVKNRTRNCQEPLRPAVIQPYSMTERIANLGEEISREEWVSTLGDLNGEYVELVGCVSPSLAKYDGEQPVLLVIPCQFTTEGGRLKSTTPYSRRLYIRLRSPVRLSAAAPVRVRGMLALRQVHEGLLLWAWGEIHDAELWRL